jgi:hypothetical protein
VHYQPLEHCAHARVADGVVGILQQVDEVLRAEAAEVGRAANALVTRLAAPR